VIVTLEPNSEFARALAAIDEKPVVLVSSGVRYTVNRTVDDELWANYDPERVRAAVRAAAGTLTPEEGERLKALVYEGREKGSRPIGRP